MSRLRTRLLASLTAIALAVTVAGPAAAVPRQVPAGVGNPAVNVFIGLLEVGQARAISNRVFANVTKEEAQVTSAYAAYVATAQAQREAATSKGDTAKVQQADRVLAVLQAEQATKAQLLTQMRQNAYTQFRKPEFALMLSTIANVGPVSRLLTSASGELGGLASKVSALRNQVSGSSGVNLLAVQAYTAQLQRWTGVWAMVSGPKGRGLTDLAEKATASLQRATAGVAGADRALAETATTLAALSSALEGVKTVAVRPRGHGFFGFITNLLGIDTRLIDALRNAIRPRVRNVPGYREADIDKVLDAAMLEMMRRRLYDCGKPTGYEVRNLADNPDLGTQLDKVTRSLGGVDERLPLCDDPTAEQLLAVGEEALDPVATGSETATRPTGGGIYTISSEGRSPGARAAMVRTDGGDLSVRDLKPPLFTLGGEAVGRPDIQLVLDFEQGTASGSFDVDYACDAESCMGQASTGHAAGTFEQVPFAVPPDGPPEDYPFPAHHWYDLEKDNWYALAATDISVQLAGTSFDGSTGAYDETVRGWVEVRLSPSGWSTGSLPNGWTADLSVRLDYPDTVNPQWTLFIGSNSQIWDPRIPQPPAAG